VGSTPKSSKPARDLASSTANMQTPTLQSSPVARYPKHISPVEAGEKAANLDDEERMARRRNKAKQRLQASDTSAAPQEVMHTPLKRARLDAAGTPRPSSLSAASAALSGEAIDPEVLIKQIRTPIPLFEAKKRANTSSEIIVSILDLFVIFIVMMHSLLIRWGTAGVTAGPHLDPTHRSVQGILRNLGKGSDVPRDGGLLCFPRRSRAPISPYRQRC
jgi:hypothetical protein